MLYSLQKNEETDALIVSNITNTDQKYISLKININSSDTPALPNEKYGYNENLNIYRNKIDNIDSDIWKKVRWYINVYDFQVKDPIVNRAFYKYWEIINEFEIFEEYTEDDIILHCAEAPGGFIQGSNIYLQIDRSIKNINTKPDVDEDGFITVKKRKFVKNNYKIYTISLNKDLPQYKNYNLPTYNKNIMNKYLYISYGKDNTGDINNFYNIDHIKSISKGPFYLVTADGGFDEGNDFNHKEQLHYNLILSEIYSAISLQKTDGHFILKMFDILTDSSIHLIYLLSLCYKEVYIYKPKTSRPTNSEKYIICKYFNLPIENKEKYLCQLKYLSNSIKLLNCKFISFTLFDSIPDEFINQIKKCNDVLLKKQCDHLEKAILLCNDISFIKEYENQLQESFEKRREIFHEWETLYNLDSYV
jgi:23S rRNA U2552 (ribose-2'-O)-methylase RlmE/FtsJ